MRLARCANPVTTGEGRQAVSLLHGCPFHGCLAGPCRFCHARRGLSNPASGTEQHSMTSCKATGCCLCLVYHSGPQGCYPGGVCRCCVVPVPGERGTVVRWYDRTEDSPCVAVIDSIARYEAVATPGMAERPTPLEQTLDTDALDALISDTPASSFSFDYAEYFIHISGGTVAISQPIHSST